MTDSNRTAPSAHESRLRVYYEDTDAGGIVYYANYLRFFERARTDWLRALGVAHRELAERDGLVFVVRDVAVEYLRPARLDDELIVDVRLVELRRASLRVAQTARLAPAGVVAGGVAGSKAAADPCAAVLTAAGTAVSDTAGSPLATGTVRIAVVDRDSGRPAALPAWLHRMLLDSQQ